MPWIITKFLAVVFVLCSIARASVIETDNTSVERGPSGTPNSGTNAAVLSPIARAADSSAKSASAAVRARGAADAATLNAIGSNVALPAAEAKTNSALQQLVNLRQQAKALFVPVEQQAYAVARERALVEVGQLKAEAAAYGRKLQAEFDASLSPRVDPLQVAVAKATQPYVETERAMAAWVDRYRMQANELLGQVRSLVSQANAFTQQAAQEQASHATAPAKKHRLLARTAADAAMSKRRLARRIRRLADDVNNAIPKYEQAREMVAERIMSDESTIPTGPPL